MRGALIAVVVCCLLFVAYFLVLVLSSTRLHTLKLNVTDDSLLIGSAHTAAALLQVCFVLHYL